MPFIVKKTLELVKASQNDAIIQVKSNQKTLYQDCQRLATRCIPDEVYQEPFTKNRNRLESRQVEVFFYPVISDCLGWGAIKSVIKVTRQRQLFHTKTRTWHETNEIAYYISTCAGSAEWFCQAIRRHWGIENRNHYVRDVTLGEDRSRIRINPHIFAKLRSFALNILRANQIENVSAELFDNCMNLNQLLNYRGIF